MELFCILIMVVVTRIYEYNFKKPILLYDKIFNKIEIA